MPSASTTPATTTPLQPRALTLPASIIATLSPHPYLLNHLQRNPSVRPNGRRPSTFRAPICTTSSLTHCFGSSVVRTGDTTVACGIQGEILYAKNIADPPLQQEGQEQQAHTQEQAQMSGQNHDREDADDQALRQLSLLVPNIELATGCSPNHLPSSVLPSREAQTLAHRIYALLLSSRVVRLADLRIPYATGMPGPQDTNSLDGESPLATEPVAYWTLYISLSVLSLAGTTSLFDTLWGALLAALTDLRLPRAWWDADRECVVCSESVQEARRLVLRGRPVVVSWGVFEGRREDGYMHEMNQDQDSSKQHGSASGDVEKQRDAETKGERLLDDGVKLGGGRKAWFLADPDAFEEPLCRETVTVALDCSLSETRLLGVERSGGGVVEMGELRELVRAAEERWDAWNGVLPAA